MRILGIDYGLTRIGVAVSDPTGLVAQPHTVVRRTDDAQAAAAVVRLAQELAADQVVVGWPLHMNGSAGEKAQAAAAFAARLRDAAGLPVQLYDERLTTVAAERMLIQMDVRRKDRRQVVDAVAASIMLQGFLDGGRGRTVSDTPSGGED